MENKELENLIETSWNSRDEINERTVGKIKEAVEQTLNLLGNGTPVSYTHLTLPTKA